jgi:hypothetical protein
MLRKARRAVGIVVCMMKLRARGFHVRCCVNAERCFSNRSNAENDLRDRGEKDSRSP